MEMIMESHGISKAQDSMNPAGTINLSNLVNRSFIIITLLHVNYL